MLYAVDEIIDNIVRVQNLETKEMVELKKEDLPDVKDGDVLKEENGIFTLDMDEKIRRLERIQEKFNRLKENK